MSNAVILDIEDNVDNRTLIRGILTAEGYTLKVAGNAGEAMEKLKILHPDLILKDINISDLDGYMLTSQVRARSGFKNVPIVAFTANVMRGDRE
jgi:CheY-like chemotaxis protein